MSGNEKTIFELNQFEYASPFGDWIKERRQEIKVQQLVRDAYQPQQIPFQNPKPDLLSQIVQEQHECYDQYGNDHGVVIVILRGSTMMPFVAFDYWWLSDAAKAMDQVSTTEFSINAQFAEGTISFGNQGLTYHHGENLGGSSQPGWYFIAQNQDGEYSFGLGDPPPDSWNAVGGGRPLIINGLPFGDENLYRKGAPSGLPVTGQVPAEHMQFLIQKSAAYFRQQNTVSKGKMIVAHHPVSDQIAIVGQEDGTSEGMLLSTLRNILIDYGYTNALSFDGSDSTMLIKDTDVIIDNGNLKDRTTNSGITFSVPC